MSTELASRPELRSAAPFTSNMASGKTTSPQAGLRSGHNHAAPAITAAKPTADAVIAIHSNRRLNGIRRQTPGMAATPPKASPAAAAGKGGAIQATPASGISATQTASLTRPLSTTSSPPTSPSATETPSIASVPIPDLRNRSVQSNFDTL
ncbi:MAG TPA: hypothetical protein VFI65_26435 [Streptosporangiaceae bacterium]|nr:hypothetical protein [Streptosporangiaceae bacterium]